jgi:proton-coupled amino acid transporter
MHTIGTNDKSEESRDSAKTASTGCNDVFDSPPSASLVPTQSDKRRTNYRDTAQNLFKAYVGSGILALPYAFARAGYLLSTFVFLGIAYIVYDCFRLMFKIVDTYEKKDIDFS